MRGLRRGEERGGGLGAGPRERGVKLGLSWIKRRERTVRGGKENDGPAWREGEEIKKFGLS